MRPCESPECSDTIKDHAWGRIKSGWFQTKDDKFYCPAHIPAWVEAWRSRQKQRL